MVSADTDTCSHIYFTKDMADDALTVIYKLQLIKE